MSTISLYYLEDAEGVETGPWDRLDDDLRRRAQRERCAIRADEYELADTAMVADYRPAQAEQRAG